MNSIVYFEAANGVPEGTLVTTMQKQRASFLPRRATAEWIPQIALTWPSSSPADTGTAAPDAERRVDEVAARAKQDISRARSSAVILAFMAGAAALLGAIAAWAVTAGRYRDGQGAIPALWDWGSESRSLFSKNPRRGQ